METKDYLMALTTLGSLLQLLEGDHHLLSKTFTITSYSLD